MNDAIPPALASGTTSQPGSTFLVEINQPDLDPVDKKVLCSALCYCNQTPNIGINGQQLKQACVAQRVKALDTLLEHRSPYKQEINYDMSQQPPAPIMDRGVVTKGHDFLPGWIKKYWGGEIQHAPIFKAGKGLIRRPDVVIVKDPSKPPTQDNIKQIVEMKFPPDSISKAQSDSYELITGDPKKLKTLKPADCDCAAPEPEPATIPVAALGWAATAASWIMYAATRGRSTVPSVPAF